MEQSNTFSYHYSAPENIEIQKIRKKYLPKEKNKLDELKKLDRHVQTSGQLPSLTIGIGGCLVFGLGLCFIMKVIGDSVILGVLLGIVGLVGMLLAYPVHRYVFSKTKSKFTPRILQLMSELTGEKTI